LKKALEHNDFYVWLPEIYKDSLRGFSRLPRITGLLLALLIISVNMPLIFVSFPTDATASILKDGVLLGNIVQRESDNRWNQFFDNNQTRLPRSITESDSGGFVVTGCAIQSTTGIGDEHVWLAKVNSEGNIAWEGLYAIGHRGWGQAVIECPNYDLIVAGAIDDEFSNVLVFRTDSSGNVLWERILNFTEHQEAHALTLLPWGDLIVCGWAWHYRPTNPIDGLVICLDENGLLRWHRELGGLGDDFFYSIAWDPNGELVLTGTTENLENQLISAWVVKTDLQGNVVWNRTFGDSMYARGNSIVCDKHHDLTIAGVIQSAENDRFDAFVIHTDFNGNLLWTLTSGLELDEMARSIILCSDGGYAITGELSQSEDTPWHDIMVIRLDDHGGLLWQKAYGSEGNDVGMSLVECWEGDLVLAASTSSFGFVGGTTWLTRIPDAPPPAVDPRHVNIPMVLVGMTLALIVLGIVASIYFISGREFTHRVRECV
jgi:hypothetical protein